MASIYTESPNERRRSPTGNVFYKYPVYFCKPPQQRSTNFSFLDLWESVKIYITHPSSHRSPSEKPGHEKIPRHADLLKELDASQHLLDLVQLHGWDAIHQQATGTVSPGTHHQEEFVNTCSRTNMNPEKQKNV